MAELEERFCGSMEEDVEFHTESLLEIMDSMQTAEACCARCDADPRCGVWTFARPPGAAGPGGSCVLRGLEPDLEPKRITRQGAISGRPAGHQRKHGVVASLLAEADLQPAEDRVAESAPAEQTCPGLINVTGFGVLSVVSARWQTPGNPAGSVEVEEGAWGVAPGLQSRAYLAQNCTPGSYKHDDFAAIELLGKTLRYKTDVSRTGCGCIAQLQLLPMHHNLWKSHCEDYYCGAAGPGAACGVPCSEIDVQNANQYAWSSTLHARSDSKGLSVGYGGSNSERGSSPWSDSEYGPGARCIDTTWPFEVAVSFPRGGKGELSAMEVRLSQETQACSLMARMDDYSFGGRSALAELSAVLELGVTPVVSYWSSPDLRWLDGLGRNAAGPCVKDSPEACPASTRFYDFRVEDITEENRSDASREDSPLEVAASALHAQLSREAASRRKADLGAALAMRPAAEVVGSLKDCHPDCDAAGIEVIGDAYADQAKAADQAQHPEDGSQATEVLGGSSTAAQAGLPEESSDGNVEWEIVAEEVQFLAECSASARVLGTRQQGAVFVGHEEGGWLVLGHASGCVAIHDGQTVLLKKRTVSYRTVSGGSCASNGAFSILDIDVCQVAAFSLGYFDTVQVSQDSEPRPEGCHLHEGRVRLNRREANQSKGIAGAYLPVCSSAGYSRTTTTTTTSTTTVTTTLTTTFTTTVTSTSTTTTTTTTWGFPSLFCISVMRMTGYEPGLVKAQIRDGVGIFQCDEYAIFTGDGEADLGRLPNGAMVTTATFKKAKVGVSQDHTAANTLLFMHLWDAVKHDGRYQRHQWTIKADPDAVVVVPRLRERLRKQTGPMNYLVNCNKHPGTKNFPMIFGAVEAYSARAMLAYFDDAERCRTELEWHEWGEDFFMGRCMKLLGVAEFDDFDIVGDKRCMGADCSDGVAGAYHDFKSIDTWFKCWREATR